MVRRDVPWSGRTFSGALILGWGRFNVVEGLIDRQLLGLHHVYEYSANHLPADLGFLAFGLLRLLLGGGRRFAPVARTPSQPAPAKYLLYSRWA